MSNKKRRVTKLQGNVLFNDALNTFYVRLYGVGDEITSLFRLGFTLVWFFHGHAIKK